MKMNVEVDCTPEEARRFLGLPDLTVVHDAYTAKMLDMVENGPTPELLETMMKSWAPMGEAGFKLWSQMFERVGGPSKQG